ncbi:MAG: protein tyrosine phosphatase family protein [Dehalococcoidia bacterium]
MPDYLRTAALLATLVSATPAVAAQGQPANFVEWRDGLHSSAQPSAAWLSEVKQRRYDLVINLAPPQSHGSLRDEGGIVGTKGVVYVNIPVDFSKPAAEDFRQFSEIVKANAGRNVFVHCQVNLRGSSFVFLYRVIHENAPIGETAIKLNAVWAPDRVWRKFIDRTLEAHGRKGEVF